MAQQHLEPPTNYQGRAHGDALAGYLRAQATEFLRCPLRQHRENGSDAGTTARAKPRTESRAESRDGSRAGENGSGESVDAARALRRSARRISGTLHAFRPLLDAEWSEGMRPELAWLSGRFPWPVNTPTQARLERLIGALNRLSGRGRLPAQAAQDAGAPAKGSLTVGAAKAGALLDRQLTLARTRAHSAALQALGSSRFHAVADSVAVLASEVPLTPAAATADLRPLAAAASDRLTDAVAALPLVTAGHPYNAEALVHGLSADTAPHPQDAPWHQVRLLLRLHRYACEVLYGEDAPIDVRLLRAGQALNRHRDAAEGAGAAASAAAPRASPRPPRTRSACSTPTSGTRWRRRGSRSSRTGRRKPCAPREGGLMTEDTFKAVRRRSSCGAARHSAVSWRYVSSTGRSTTTGRIRRASSNAARNRSRGHCGRSGRRRGTPPVPGTALPTLRYPLARPPQGGPLLGCRGDGRPLHSERRGSTASCGSPRGGPRPSDPAQGRRSG